MERKRGRNLFPHVRMLAKHALKDCSDAWNMESSCPWNFNKLPPLKTGGWLKRVRISFLKSLWNSIPLFNQMSEYLLVPVSVHHRVQHRNDATNKLSCSKNKLEPNLHHGKMQTHSTCSQAKIFHCGLVATI